MNWKQELNNFGDKIQLELHYANNQKKNMMMKNLELEHRSDHDALTGLAKRYSINKYCAKIFKEAKQMGKAFGVLITDVDYFKEYNDTYGHVHGDECIREVATKLSEVAKGHIVARFGGDEFLVMSLGQKEADMKRLAQNICEGIQEMKIIHNGSKSSPYVSVTVGVVNRNLKIKIP